MESVLQDFRFGYRMLFRNPSFTIVVVTVLALGIGASTAIFSAVNAVLIRPLPYDDPDRLVLLSEKSQELDLMSVPLPDYFDWRERNEVFSGIAAYRSQSFNLTSGSEPERIPGAAVSASLFQLMGVKFYAGRAFSPDEDKPGGDRVVILSYGLWQRRFGSNPDALGQKLFIDGNSYLVIGIAAPSFEFPRESEMWVPLGYSYDALMNRGMHPGLWVIARLKPSVSLGQAEATMGTIASQLESEYPDTNQGVGISVVPLYEELVGGVRLTLLIVLGVVGFVLLISCLNVANLLLVRSTARKKEIALRAALGAGRARLVRQLLTESMLLALLGGICGFLLAAAGNRILVALSPDNIPRIKDMSLDGRVFAFAVLISVLTSLIFGLAPALQASKADLNEALKESGGRAALGSRHNRIRTLLVASEIGLSLILLIGAGLMVRSFLGILDVDLGLSRDNLLTMQVSLPQYQYPEGPKMVQFYQQVLERVQGLPEVESASLSSSLPLSNAIENFFVVEGQYDPTADRYSALYQVVSTDYFGTMGIPLISGRIFSDRDNDKAPGVAIIDESMARRFWPNEDPIGKRIKIGGAAASPVPWLSIVGVVKHVRQFGLDLESREEIYVPYLQLPSDRTGPLASTRFLVVRSGASLTSLASRIKQEISMVDKDLPVANIKSMQERFSESISRQRFFMLLLVIFAVVALILAVVGVYGVINYFVSQRTHEIGLRMALGAQQSDVLKLVIGQGTKIMLVGLIVGVVVAWILTRILSSLLYEVSPTDPLTFAGMSVVLVLATLVASYIPARRAARVDPMVALRYE